MKRQILTLGLLIGISWAGAAQAQVTSVSNADGSLTLSPNPITGTGTISLNAANANSWTGTQSFTLGDFAASTASPGASLNIAAGTSPDAMHVHDGDIWYDGTSHNLALYTQSLAQGAFRCDNTFPLTTDFTSSVAFCTQPVPPTPVGQAASYPYDWGHSIGSGSNNSYNEIIGSTVNPSASASTFNRMTGFGALILQTAQNASNGVAIGSGAMRNARYVDRDVCVAPLCMSWMGAQASLAHEYHQDIWDYYSPTQSSFTGSISGTTLSASGVSGPALAVGDSVADGSGNVAGNTQITAILGGGNYTVNVSQSVGSEPMTAQQYCAPGSACWDPLNIESLLSGTGALIASTGDASAPGDVAGNTCIGRDCLNQLHIGTYNTADGYKACSQNYNTTYDTCVGQGSGWYGVFVNDSTRLGALSGEYGISGANNTDVGYAADQYTVQPNNLTVLGANGINDVATFTGSITGTTLTVTGSVHGLIHVGEVLTDAASPTNLAYGTVITALGTGGGGAGTYTVNNSQTVGSESLTAQVDALSDVIAIGEDSFAETTKATTCIPQNNEFLVHEGGQGWGPTIRAQMDTHLMSIFMPCQSAMLGTLEIGPTDSTVTSLATPTANGLVLNSSGNNGMTILSGASSTSEIDFDSTAAQLASIGYTASSGNLTITTPNATFSGILTAAGAVNAQTSILINGTLLASATAPTISSGFGTSPGISGSNGTAAFNVRVGTGGTASSGTIGLPTASSGWNCYAVDITTQSTSVFLTKQTGGSATTAVFTNYNTAGAATPWVASDHLRISCFAL